MNITLYVLYSGSLNRYYVGITGDLQRRLSQHRQGCSRWTSRGGDWQVVYTEVFGSMAEARQREKTVKARGAKRYLSESGLDKR